MAGLEGTLRGLAVQDEQVVRSMLLAGLEAPQASGSEAKVHALARLGATISVGAPAVSHQAATALALAAGATAQDVVDLLSVIAPIVGCPRIVAAAPAVALALGYDVDAALEEHTSWR